MKLTDLCDDILFKIEDEIKIIKDNKKYKNSYDNFVKKFEFQIDYMKYELLCDDFMSPNDALMSPNDDDDDTDDPPLDYNWVENNLDSFDITRFIPYHMVCNITWYAEKMLYSASLDVWDCDCHNDSHYLDYLLFKGRHKAI